MRIPLVLSLTGTLFVQAAGALPLAGFVQCVGAAGQGTVCRLDAGTYPISATISIGRSNMTIAGTILNSSRATTLRRAAGFQGPLFIDNEAPGTTLQSITVRDLTIDGNRAQNQAAYSSYSPDVSIFAVKQLLFVNCAFINSPSIGLGLYGAGTSGVVVDRSYFGNPVIYGLWSDALVDTTNLSYLNCSTVKLVDDVTVSNSLFENSGEPAILGEMTNVQILNNVFTNNHSNSIPFNDDGGQIDLTTCTQGAVIWRNTFQNGAASPNGHVADGIELHGTYIDVIDNTVKNNSGGGINLDGVQHVHIANWDPSTGSFGNGHSGVEIGHSSSALRPTDWVTVESATAIGNAQYGIWSDTSNTTPLQPVNHLTIVNSCLSGNVFSPTYLVNLGFDATIRNNKVSGCGPE